MEKEKLSAKQIKGLLAQFNPHYYSEEHINLIQHGSPEQVVELVKTNKLSRIEEIELVKKALVEAVKKYIRTCKNMSEDAQVALVDRRNVMLINCYLQKFHYFSPAAEAELVRYHRLRSQKWWENYFCGHSLSCAAELALVDTRDRDFLYLYLDNHSLENDACMRLVETYIYDELRRLIRDCPRFCLTKNAELYFINEKSFILGREYISKFRLQQPAEIALVKSGDHDLIMLYLEKHKTVYPDTVTELAKRANYDEIAKLLEFQKLPSEAEAMLVLNASDKMFDLLIKNGPLSANAQFMIIKNKDEYKRNERIMKYLAKYPMDIDITEMLIKRGDTDEIKACIKQKCLSDKAAELLIRRGKKDEIELYISVSHPEWKIPE